MVSKVLAINRVEVKGMVSIVARSKRATIAIQHNVITDVKTTVNRAELISDHEEVRMDDSPIGMFNATD